jgi:hypothetical protein
METPKNRIAYHNLQCKNFGNIPRFYRQDRPNPLPKGYLMIKLNKLLTKNPTMDSYPAKTGFLGKCASLC